MLAMPNVGRLRPPLPPIAPVLPAYTITVSEEHAIMIPPRQAYASIIAEAATRYRIDAALIASVMEAESAFNPFAVSRAGAMGLMQLMPAVAEAHGAFPETQRYVKTVSRLLARAHSRTRQTGNE